MIVLIPRGPCGRILGRLVINAWSGVLAFVAVTTADRQFVVNGTVGIVKCSVNSLYRVRNEAVPPAVEDDNGLCICRSLHTDLAAVPQIAAGDALAGANMSRSGGGAPPSDLGVPRRKLCVEMVNNISSKAVRDKENIGGYSSHCIWADWRNYSRTMHLVVERVESM